MTFSEADDFCVSAGGNVMTILDADVQRLFEDEMNMLNVSDAWIGLVSGTQI